MARRKHQQIFGLLLTAGTGLLLLTSTVSMAMYARTPLKLMARLGGVSVNGPIRVNFNVEVNSHLNYNLSPGAKGSWRTVGGLVGITAIEFTPSSPLIPSTTYRLTMGHISKIGSARPDIDHQVIVFTTEPAPALISITPADNATNTPTNPTVRLRLASPNHGLRRLQLLTDAGIEVRSQPASHDQEFNWTFVSPLPQGKLVHLTFNDLNQTDPARRHLAATSFTTVPEPQIVTATTTDHFYPGDKITIQFDQAMTPDKTHFNFGLPGSGSWSDPQTYTFTPGSLQPGQTYSYTAQRGAVSTHGGVTLTDHTYSLSPPGNVYVTSTSPGGGNVSLNATINFTFDQPVDHASAQAAFSFIPGVSGSFSWSGNTMVFHPAGLDYQTTYVASLRSGIQSIYGLPSQRPSSFSFTTTYQVIKLGVPYYHQQYSLSCEEASLRMALAFRGIFVSDLDVLNQVGYNPRPRDTATNSWDDPYLMFVGDVNGSQGSTGWGVYSGPIAIAARNLGRSATAITGITATQIAQAIHGGNPVVLWGFSGATIRSDSWNTTTSGVVQAPLNEHVRTVYGVAGSPSNPLGFYINDPIHGQLYWTTAQLNWNMSFANTLPSQGVIVY